MPLRKRIESFQRKPYFLRVNNDLEPFSGEKHVYNRKNLGHKLVLVTDILQSNASSLQAQQRILCLSHNRDNFIILQPLPWGKFLLAPRFWGFTWPAAIRVLSRRNRENPGNEVDILISFPNGPFARDVILLLLPESIRWKKETLPESR